MKSLYFNIDSYSFPNKLKKLLRYLNEKKIEYIINKDTIEYFISVDGHRIECIGYIYKNRITDYKFFSKTTSKEDIEYLKKKISSRYCKKYSATDSELTYYTTYPKVGVALEIILSEKDEFYFVVAFEDDSHRLFDHEVRKKNVIETITILACALIGLGLSIFFLYLYSKENNLTRSIITAIISYIYMSLSIYMLLKMNKEDKKKTILSMLLWPVIYVVIVFIVLLLLGDNQNMILEYIFWAIYSMPAFIIIVVVALLLLAGASYA